MDIVQHATQIIQLEQNRTTTTHVPDTCTRQMNTWSEQLLPRSDENYMRNTRRHVEPILRILVQRIEEQDNKIQRLEDALIAYMKARP